VASAVLLAAFSLRIKMKRAAAGVKAIGLKDAALIPAKGGVMVDMPSISTFVPVITGALSETVVFEVRNPEAIVSVLSKYGDDFKEVAIAFEPERLSFRIGKAVWKLTPRVIDGRQIS
jgi:hypothetical protein